MKAIQRERQLEIEDPSFEVIVIIGELERVLLTHSAIGPFSHDIGIGTAERLQVIDHRVGERADEIRKDVLDCVQAEIIDAMIDPCLARADEILCNVRIVLVPSAQISQEAMMHLPIVPQIAVGRSVFA